MELKEGMSVVTPNGEEIGNISRFILDPATNQITHLVIEKGKLFTEDKVLPFRMIRPAEDRVVLKDATGNLEELPPFEEKYFVRADNGEDVIPTGNNTHTIRNASTYIWYPSVLNTGFPAYELENPSVTPVEIRRNVPDKAVSLKEGSKVISSDGKHVGDVERLVVGTESNQVTHFLISQGLLFKDEKLVPMDWVKSIEEDKVELAVTSQVLQRLPSYQETPS
jgi:uncharacterized protein YrrD